MIFIRTSLIFVLGVYSTISAESTPKTSPTTNTWARPATSSGHGFSKPKKSKLDDFSAIDKKKRAELDSPLIVKILAFGRSVDGLEEIKDRIIDIQITNPNPYPIFFQGPNYRENTTITQRWKTLRDGVWVWAAPGCGRGEQDWDIDPGQSIDVMIYLHPGLKEQQILGRFYRADKPSIQSDCPLYEKK